MFDLISQRIISKSKTRFCFDFDYDFGFVIHAGDDSKWKKLIQECKTPIKIKIKIIKEKNKRINDFGDGFLKFY